MSTVYSKENAAEFFTHLGKCLGLEMTKQYDHGAAYRVDAYTQIFVSMWKSAKASATLGANHRDANTIGVSGEKYRYEIGFSASKDVYKITQDIKRRLLDNDIYQQVRIGEIRNEHNN